MPGDEISRLRRARIERYRTVPPTWMVVLRPFGYAAVGVLWSVLTLVVLALPWILPLQLLDRGWSASATLRSANPGDLVAYCLVIALIAGPLVGYLFVALPLATGSLAVLSGTYVVRSLKPSYRRERLSATGWSYGTIGLSVLPTGLSLIPIRMTRWSAFWCGLYAMGWFPSLGMLRVGAVAGIGYFGTILWLFWPLTADAAVAASCAASLAVAAFVVVLLVVEARRRYFTPPADVDVND